MDELNGEMLKILEEIRDLLKPISGCFEEQFAALQQQRSDAKLEELKPLLTPERRKVYPLLFDQRGLSQIQIAKTVGISQPAVSRFISILLEAGLIERREDSAGNLTYVDRFNLADLVEVPK